MSFVDHPQIGSTSIILAANALHSFGLSERTEDLRWGHLKILWHMQQNIEMRPRELWAADGVFCELTQPPGWATFPGNEREFHPDASRSRFPARDGRGAELAQVDDRGHDAARRNSKMM